MLASVTTKRGTAFSAATEGRGALASRAVAEAAGAAASDAVVVAVRVDFPVAPVDVDVALAVEADVVLAVGFAAFRPVDFALPVPSAERLLPPFFAAPLTGADDTLSAAAAADFDARDRAAGAAGAAGAAPEVSGLVAGAGVAMSLAEGRFLAGICRVEKVGR